MSFIGDLSQLTNLGNQIQNQSNIEKNMPTLSLGNRKHVPTYSTPRTQNSFQHRKNKSKQISSRNEAWHSQQSNMGHSRLHIVPSVRNIDS